MLPVKILGLTFVFASCAFFGFLKSIALGRRAEQLTEVITGLACLKEQIRFSGGELKTVLPLCLGGVCAVRIENDGVTVLKNGLCDEDIAILKRLFDGLGSGDITAETNRIERAVASLKVQQSGAAEDFSKKGKLWRGGGVCVGTAICILLI